MSKQIYDPIHGFISITPLMQNFIDTSEFQRLRDLKQLGATYFVFPSATHTRFEHSLGVSHLAGLTMSSLKNTQPELGITEKDIELTRIAGLLHDIGHGPFSHLYDHYVKEPTEPEHEERGIEIIKNMVEKYEINITKDELNKVINMIDPDKNNKKLWMYQIVANKICSIDVDKIDYIQRDCYHIGMKFGGEYSRLMTDCRVKKTQNSDELVLAWPKKLEFEIYNLFNSRYRLHKQVLSHHTVKAYEYYIIEILRSIKQDGYDFLALTDSIVFCNLHQNQLYDDIKTKMFNRQIPKLVCEKILPYTATTGTIHMFPRRIVDLLVDKVDLGFASGGQNPLTSVYYFENNNEYSEQTDPTKNSFSIPTQYRESILRLYTYDRNREVDAKKYWDILISEL
jgi:HD superfamily phosphohydrolase